MANYEMDDDISGIGSDSKYAVQPKGWMAHHSFILVNSIEQLDQIIEQAIRSKFCALDLETQGLDSRVYYGTPKSHGVENRKFGYIAPKGRILQTVHQIVGYCICYDGITGYYIPVGHAPYDWDERNDKDPNLPFDAVAEKIKQLCLASQPTPQSAKELEHYARDPYGWRSDIPGIFHAYPDPNDPNVMINGDKPFRIGFWNSKFDQEMLYPITGLDWWHPDSFVDGMVADYVHNTSLKGIGLKTRSGGMRELKGEPEDFKGTKWFNPEDKRWYEITGELIDHNGNPYEMIEITELFPELRGKVRFESLDPTALKVRQYGGSDAICTYRFCNPQGFNPNAEWIVRDGEREPNPYYVPNSIAKVPNIVGACYTPGFSFTHRLETQLVPVLRSMERNRISILRSPLIREREHYYKLLEEQTKVVQNGFSGYVSDVREINPGSPKQLGSLLYDDDKMNAEPKPPKTANDQWQTSADVFEELARDPRSPKVLTEILRYREIQKYISTYLDNLIQNTHDPIDGHRIRDLTTPTGEIRLTFKAVGAETGRFSAPADDPDQGFSGVPVQGIPTDTYIRRSFEAREGYCIVKCDYAGEELRIATNLSGEKVWIDEFNNGKGDLHSITARAIYGKAEVSKEERAAGKCVLPSTLVQAPHGLVKLEHLGNYPKDPDTFTPSNNSNWVWDGFSEQPVSHLYNGGEQRVVHVVSNRHIITCTPQHKFLGRDGQWVKALNLRPGDTLPLVNTRLLSDNAVQPIEFRGSGVPGWILNNRNLCLDWLGHIVQLGKVVRGLLEWRTTDFILMGHVAAIANVCGLQYRLKLIKLGNDGVKIQFDQYSGLQLKPHIPSKRLQGRIISGDPGLRTEDFNIILGVLDGGTDYVVDITVHHPDHAYWANGFISSNSTNFALVYGGGPAAVMRATGCTRDVAVVRKEAFDNSVKELTKWIKGQHIKVKRDGGVRTPFGRWLTIPLADESKVLNWKQQQELKKAGLWSKGNRVFDDHQRESAKRAESERCAVNYAIQGAGADIMKIVLVKLYKKFRQMGWINPMPLKLESNQLPEPDPIRILMTVHDEVVFEIRHSYVTEVLPLIVDIMESPSKDLGWEVPLVVEPLVGFNWQSGYTVERHKDGETIDDPYRKLVNGFVYHLSRPAKFKGELLKEDPDRNEVLEGKSFVLTECPWLNVPLQLPQAPERAENALQVVVEPQFIQSPPRASQKVLENLVVEFQDGIAMGDSKDFGDIEKGGLALLQDIGFIYDEMVKAAIAMNRKVDAQYQIMWTMVGKPKPMVLNNAPIDLELWCTVLRSKFTERWQNPLIKLIAPIGAVQYIQDKRYWSKSVVNNPEMTPFLR